MIYFSDDKKKVTEYLAQNKTYLGFINSDSVFGHITIRVEKGEVLLFHNNDDTFTVAFVPAFLDYFYEHLDAIRRIAKDIQDIAHFDFLQNSQNNQ